MNVTNLEMTQATIEIFGGFICLMLNVIILMNGTFCFGKNQSIRVNVINILYTHVSLYIL